MNYVAEGSISDQRLATGLKEKPEREDFLTIFIIFFISLSFCSVSSDEVMKWLLIKRKKKRNEMKKIKSHSLKTHGQSDAFSLSLK